MEEDAKRPLTPFDELLTPSYLHLMKVLFPFLPSANQNAFAVGIKFMELEHTLHYFQRSHSPIHMQAMEKKQASLKDIVKEVIPYLSSSERKNLEQVSAMLQAIELFHSMQNTSAASTTDYLKNLLTPEQQEQFKMYESVFQQEFDTSKNDSSQKGDHSYEPMDEPSETPKHGAHQTPVD